MVPHQLIVWATQSPWRWLLRGWKLRASVQALAIEFQQSPTHVALAAAKIELDMARTQVKELEEHHQLARQGNAALIRFIHTRHRLNVPFDPKSIRGILQKADQ